MPDKTRILVVEDDPKNQKIIKQIFSEDYELIPIFDGEEALRSYREYEPDFILLDIMLPGIDGYEVCKTIKADADYQDVPIVMLSAKTSLDDRLKGYEMGADDYMTKPFDHDELVVKIKNLISYKKSLRSLNQQASNASNIAMQAMTVSSELGQILQFMQSSFAIKDMEGLIKEVLSVTEKFDLKVCIQVQTGNSDASLTMCDTGVVTPLEESILTQAKIKGRIFDFRNRTIINYPNISLLIKNMPLDNPDRYGMIKDNICFLVEAAQARIINLVMEKEIDKQRSTILQILNQTTKFMEVMNTNFHGLRAEQAKIVDHMMARIEDLIPRLGLQESQEETLLNITRETTEGSTNLFNEGLKLNDEFTETMKQLQQVCNAKGSNNSTFENVLKKLSQY
jgi:DNA-binding response OmpR family regulator